ncbi:sigma-54-dependent transcriptional regulator [Bordetella petrii]|uniref:sigma-54 interaction domain-containing protein n=1 Tax=Bordetella petrii TaxID=94624 RepID=UPI001A95E4D3|nr:sigma-54-dependent Fis family transcriptional regulator [Bordetella petrii]
MQEFGAQVARAARSDATVFITGESGTGKEMIARAIHDGSDRGKHPFVAVNCGAFSHSLAHAQLFGHEKGSFTGALSQTAGYFESASGGTLFLDEVTEMSDGLQVQFLRVLESGTYQRVGGSELLHTDARIVCATNRDPYAAVERGELREDFLHRLLVVPLRVPPLREREGDVRLLAQRFLDELNTAHQANKRFSARMMDALLSYDWPGNVRELRNVVQRAFILADTVVEAEFRRRTPAPDARGGADDALCFPIGTPLSQAQRDVILATLAHHDGDKQRTADTLGVSLKTLYNRLGAYSADTPSSTRQN